jgi:hypothetical protein
LQLKIRERKNAGARFTTARNNQYISSVTVWAGQGRDQTERRLNLSIPQGKFLFHLPFPTASFERISDIIGKAGIESVQSSEILDIVNVLIDLGVIEAGEE